MTPLAEDYTPGPFDVICARGKEARTHEGNRHFASVVAQSIARYSKAASKFEKSVLVSEIVRSVRNKSPDGGFVKKENGKWHEVGDHLAREKVGQSLRDLLHTQYRSSTKAKKRRRQEENARLCDDMLETVIRGNKYMPKRMKQLSQSIQQQGSQASDMYLSLLMTQANCDILQAIKKDAKLQKVIHDHAPAPPTLASTPSLTFSFPAAVPSSVAPPPPPALATSQSEPVSPGKSKSNKDGKKNSDSKQQQSQQQQQQQQQPQPQPQLMFPPPPPKMDASSSAAGMFVFPPGMFVFGQPQQPFPQAPASTNNPSSFLNIPHHPC